jgi:DNA invertase Pin-like site-specific DNA recombinase
MTVEDGHFLQVSELLRDLAVYVSHDRDRANQRAEDPRNSRERRDDDKALSQRLAERWSQIHGMADKFAAADPASVHTSPSQLAQIRGLASYLVYQLGQLEASPPARRALPLGPTSRPRLAGMPLRIVAYLRVSTDRQADEGMGLDVQEAAIRAWARQHKARVSFIVRDEGRSGASDVIDRPGLADALGHLHAGRANALVVAKVDRLARDLVLQEWLRAEVLRAGAELRSASPVEDLYLRHDPADPTSTLVRQILGAVAQYERDMVRLRMEAGKAMKRKAGGYVGGAPPFGFRTVHHELVADPGEQRQTQRIKRWRREGKSLREIAGRLNEEGIPARRGKWHPQTVSRIVNRAS